MQLIQQKCGFYSFRAKDAYAYSSMRTHVFEHAYITQTQIRVKSYFYLINYFSHVI